MSEQQTDKLHFLDNHTLQDLAPLLSEESYRNLRQELQRLQDNAPSASGLGIYHLNYIPKTRDEALEKARWLQDRNQWLTRMCFLLETFSRSDRRERRRLEKENQALREKNSTLQKALQRSRQQLNSLFGGKKKQVKAKNLETAREISSAKKRGAPVGHTGRTRPKPTKIDYLETIPSPTQCPHCSNEVHAEKKYLCKFIEDIAPVVKIVTEQRYQWGTCSACNQPAIHPEAQEGPQVVIGENLAAWLAVMRQQLGATYRKLSKHCTEVLGIPLTPSGVLGIINRVSTKLEPMYKGIEATLPTQKVLHGDETGWKVDGARWYLWTFCNKELAYYHLDPSRSSQVPKNIIGEDYAGIMHADFYAGYNFFSRKQRCLVHLLRDINKELEIDADDESLRILKKEIKNIVEIGQRLQQQPDSPQKRKNRQELEQTLARLADLTPENKKAKKLCKRIGRHQEELLHFVDHQDVEFHNNRAERAIRPAVIFRKISFGNRTNNGARNFAVLASVLETCRLKNVHLTTFIKKAWKAPPDTLLNLTRTLLDTS